MWHQVGERLQRVRQQQRGRCLARAVERSFRRRSAVDGHNPRWGFAREEHQRLGLSHSRSWWSKLVRINHCKPSRVALVNGIVWLVQLHHGAGCGSWMARLGCRGRGRQAEQVGSSGWLRRGDALAGCWASLNELGERRLVEPQARNQEKRAAFLRLLCHILAVVARVLWPWCLLR